MSEDQGKRERDDAAGLDDPPAEEASEPEEFDPEEKDSYEPDDDLGTGDPCGPLVRYGGEDWIEGVPTRDEIVAEQEGGVSAAIQRHVRAKKPLFFMPTDVEEVNEYVGGTPQYTLRLYGPVMDGAKAEVTITNIAVFFDVRAPDRDARGANGPDYTAFDAYLRQILFEADVTDARVETVDAYPIRGYHTAPKPFKRVSLRNLQQRKKAIAAVRARGLETASDDRSSYYRKAAREYGLPLSDWAVLSDYTHVAGPTERSPLCAHVFRVAVTGYRPLIDAMAPKAAREKAAEVKAQAPLLSKDRTLVVTWDIETYSDRGKGELPDAVHDGDRAFMLCLTAHWKDDPSPLRRVCIVDVETAPDARWTTVICGSPMNVLKAFALVWRGLAPDIQPGFNDSAYDWPFIVEKARKLRILGWMFGQMTAAPRGEITDDAVLRWSYARDKKIKISAEETFFSSYLKVPGCVPMDVRACYKKLYPKSEISKKSSLKFYLEISGLSGKADMPVKRMWRYYERALESEGEPDAQAAEQMRHVAHYCTIDALRCQQLLVRRNVVNDYREVSSLAFVSLFDSHYYAGGMKVCNLLGAYAWRRGIVASMIPREQEETGKYPGAYVFPPVKGIVPDPARLAAIDAAAAAVRTSLGPAAARAAVLEAFMARGAPGQARAAGGDPVEALVEAFAAFAGDRPVTGLDFASLYPSLIMAYNLSPEKILLTAEEAEYWASQGLALHPIQFPFNGRTVRGWSIDHGNVPEAIGLYPNVLIDLFSKRAEVKGVLAVHGAVKELVELINGRARKDNVSIAEAARRVQTEAEAEKARTAAALAPEAPPPRISPGATLAEEVADLKRLSRNAGEQVEGVRKLWALAGEGGDAAFALAVQAEYERACFDWTCANTKQNALKVYMNTFYGEAGNSLSSFFLLQLAGGVTSAGQYNIKRVAEFVREKGFGIKYGDTDSLYLVAPARYFTECDADYAAGVLTREEWWSAMVRITMRALNQIRDEVNAFLKADNGTPYLKMAYEEVLYPVVFTGKKKYFGIPHLNEVNFRPKKLFVRGIEVVKQGQPGLAREIGYRVMWACMALDNARAVRAIVEDVLRDAVVNGGQWGFDHFVKTDAWKPAKNNVPVHRFIARMRARRAIEAADGERILASGGTPKPSLYEMPEPGERFSYVIVKTGAAFDLRGRKSAAKKGDRMEFASAARELGLAVDVAFYMINYVIGLCARFINGDPQFQPPAAARLDEKKTDEFSQKAAKKALEAFVKDLDHQNSGMIRWRGYAYRRAFRQAACVARDALVERVGGAAADVLHGRWLDFELFGDADGEGPIDATSKTVESLWNAAGAAAECAAERDAAAWNAALGRALGFEPNGLDSAPTSPLGTPKRGLGLPLKGEAPTRPSSGAAPAAAKKAPAAAAGRLYSATAPPRATTAASRRRPAGCIVAAAYASALDRMEAAIRTQLGDLVPSVSDIAARYEADLARLVHHTRTSEHDAHPEIGMPEAAGPEAVGNLALPLSGGEEPPALLGVTEADQQVLLELRRVWFEAAGLQLTRYRDTAFARHLARLKEKRLGVAVAPSRADREILVASATAQFRPEGWGGDDL